MFETGESIVIEQFQRPGGGAFSDTYLNLGHSFIYKFKILLHHVTKIETSKS